MKKNIKKISNFLLQCNKESPDKVIYLVGIFIFLWIAFISIVSLIINKYTSINWGYCIFENITGYYCPGCGGTRSVIYLLKGNLVKSIYYNIFATYAALLYIIFMGSHTLAFITKGTIKGLKFRNWFIYVGIILLILQWILKNIFYNHIL